MPATMARRRIFDQKIENTHNHWAKLWGVPQSNVLSLTVWRPIRRSGAVTGRKWGSIMPEPSDFMARAIEISRKAMIETGAAPFGAVIVKDGRIVGEGVNNVFNNNDATSHGEIEAIRDAGRTLGTWDLSGCTLYTTCEPCAMCVAAMFWARIDTLYYAATLNDCKSLGFELQPLSDLVRSPLHDRAIPATQLLANESRAVLKLWSEQPGFEPFNDPTDQLKDQTTGMVT
ncbi:Guanine deaminase [Marinibacterium anthonyi]|nr:Guanine deaminase [Marinibacterium anthonyi]